MLKIKNWTIIERQNPVSKYPSDFDVIHLYEKTPLTGLQLLTNHPLIRSVTPQRIVQRSLKFLDLDDSDDDESLNNDSNAPQNDNTRRNRVEEDEDDIINYISKHLKLDAKSKNNECCVPEFQNFRRGLSSSTDTSQQQTQQQQQSNAHSNRRLLRAIPRQITSILKADALWSEIFLLLKFINRVLIIIF